jgi:UDP-N-acetylmuramate--alanine ligase
LNERTRGKLEAAGIKTTCGHSAEHVSGICDLLVFSPAVSATHPEVRAAIVNGSQTASYPEFLGAVSRGRPTIAVAGTHGKSTTTGLLASVLSEAQQAGAVFCGAEVLGKSRHGWAGPGEWAVVEACEYRRHFLELEPEIGIVLTVEEDHFDCFTTIGDAIDAYESFLHSVKRLALVNVDSAAGRQIAKEWDCTCQRETFSSRGNAADWTVAELGHHTDAIEFDILYHGHREDRVTLSLPGRHHAANALAAYIALRAAATPRDVILSSLSEFAGLGRRLERHPDWRTVQRFDDYAHHPTAVHATLTALRQGSSSPEDRLICLFQPHQISRTERFVEEFGDALSVADEAWVLPVYAAREAGFERADELSRQVARKVKSPCVSRFIPSLDHALNTLETALRPGDVFVTLGAGDIDCLQYELPRRFP